MTWTQCQIEQLLYTCIYIPIRMYDCNANRETKIQTKCFGGARKRNKRQIEKWLCHTDIHIWGMSFPHRCADTETVLWSEWLDIKICYSQKTLTLNINLPKFNRQGPAEVPGLCNPSPHRLCVRSIADFLQFAHVCLHRKRCGCYRQPYLSVCP